MPCQGVVKCSDKNAMCQSQNEESRPKQLIFTHKCQGQSLGQNQTEQARNPRDLAIIRDVMTQTMIGTFEKRGNSGLSKQQGHTY